MELNQIRYFIQLADTLNFTEAARRSGVSQPALTKAIRRLEEELGGALIHRDGKDSRLTALGREMQIEFMRLDGLVSGIHELASNSVRGRRRILRIGIATTVTSPALSGFWQHALAQLPNIELHFLPMPAGESEAEVLSGKYDACILADAPKANFKLKIVPLYRERLMVAIASGHRFAAQETVLPEQMGEEPYLDRLNCHFRSRLIAYFMDRNIVMHPRIQSEREDWIQQLVAAGLGICSLPEHSAVASGIVLRPVQGLDMTRQVALVTVSGSANAMEMRQLAKLAEARKW